jgi:hypothetical protein
VDWAVEDAHCISKDEWIVRFRISAYGGRTPFVYYRDIEQIYGPTEERAAIYELKYGANAAAVGTFFVESAGQRAEKPFWVAHPDCTGYSSP